ncbi:MAG: hypothetical protein M3R24_20245 [Chloroflexota bacterium]|nr:hypothetical protein [Chloroflexota bacterium]PLS82217.1 MAG: hypothetical protein CYG59_04745 [Chloroflexota bacterium]
MQRGRLIRASELGEYVYCRRAWWLKHVLGAEPAGRSRRERGIALHARHGRRVWAANLLLLAGLLLAMLACALLVLS